MNRSALLVLVSLSCDGAEAARTTLVVVSDRTRIVSATNDLGYEVTLDAARVVASRIQFTVEGETHAWWDAIGDFFVGAAQAHPGHYAGGEVTGELTGPVVIDWFDPQDLGPATLLAGTYHGANLELVVGALSHGLAADDPLLGQGAYLAGTATKDGRSVRFSAQLALPEPAVIVGLPLELEVTTATTATLGIALSTIDPFENDTAFDGIDFFAVAGDAASYIFAGEAANRLRRAFFTHDHFLVTTP
jgi:hypothetical protein